MIPRGSSREIRQTGKRILLSGQIADIQQIAIRSVAIFIRNMILNLQHG